MSNTFGNNLKITVFGQSHSQAIGVVIDNFPSGIKIDIEKVNEFMVRRAPGQAFSTPRKETDAVEFVSGINENGYTCGAPITALIQNTNVRSKDYENLRYVPRPSHSDYTSFLKDGEFRDIRGGGQFSGRLTAPLVIAGALCSAFLAQKGVKIGAHLRSVGEVNDTPYDKLSMDIPQNQADFPVVSEKAKQQMQEKIKLVCSKQDSVGATIECKAIGVPSGLGEPMFNGLENKLAQIMFAIPGVKGFEVGSGFDGSKLKGSENNDPFVIENGKVTTKSNNAGGLLGGITVGTPIIFKVALKPTPSISKEQESVDLRNMSNTTLTVEGRHDPCIGVRAVAVVESCTAIALTDFLLGKGE